MRPTRGNYDNMKTAVETIFIVNERQDNRRFLQMCAHHLVDHVECTPASGWEKGQVEDQVGLCVSASSPTGASLTQDRPIDASSVQDDPAVI